MADLPAGGEGLPAFRYRFRCPEAPVGALIEASALGIFELYCNGERVGYPSESGTVYDELKPGFTDYRIRVESYCYDLTPYLREENTLVAVVAPGWWAGRISFGVFGLQKPAFVARLTLTYPGGEQTAIRTGEDWECAVVGPVLFADLYDGETIDARLPAPDAPGERYDWRGAALFSYSGEVSLKADPPVRLRPDLTRRPVSAVLYRKIRQGGSDFGAIVPRMKRVGENAECVTLYPGDHLILDMGQNMVGRPAVSLSAESGTTMTVRVSEMLNDSGSKARGNDGPAGSLYLANYRTAHALIGYTAAGGSGEVCEPRYTFYGFRYLELEVSERTEILRVEGHILTSAIPETGTLETDNAEVNRFFSNVVWGRRGNYLGIPTDCPQRDERLGWSGDTQIFGGTAAYLADIRAFMRKWLRDAADSQESLAGAYGDVIPHVLGEENGGNAGWGDAGIMVPEVLLRMYGDTAVIREQYPSMERYMEFLARYGGDGGGRTFYGDWLAYEPTEKPYIALVYYANDARLMAKYARILSERAGDFYDGRAKHYEALFRHLQEVWREKYLTENALREPTQTACLLALRFGLAEGDAAREISSQLLRNLREHDSTLTTGFLGTGILAQTLSEIGEDNMAYSLLLQTKDPSWLYSVRQGATTVWERWNSYTRERGFGDVNMNSFNHYAYGAVVEWLFASAAGIRPDPDSPGFTHLILAPKPDTRRGAELPAGQTPIRRLCASYDSIHGRVESAWEYEGETFVWRFTVPAEITATVYFPCLTAGVPDPARNTVTLNGVQYTVGELCGEKKGNTLIFELPSGRYEAR